MNDEHLRQRYPELAKLVDGPEFTAIAIAFQAKDREVARLRGELDVARTTRDETHVWTNTDWKERAEQAEARARQLDDLAWLAAAGVDVIIGTADYDGGAELRVALDLEDEPDDNPSWSGPLGESLADARAYCEANGMTP